jgi:hypothetical protein
VLPSSIPRQLAATPMRIFARWVERLLNVSVQRPHDAANIVGPPAVATRISASIAACHSGASCSAFGSFVMKLPASSRVTRWRPPGSGIGSSNDRFQPRPLMAPTLLVELGPEAFGQPRYFVLFRLVTPRAGRPGGAAGAGVFAFPRPIGMAFTNPAAVLTSGAFHGLPSLPGLLPRLTARRAASSQPKSGRTSAPFRPQAWQVKSLVGPCATPHHPREAELALPIRMPST